MLKRVVLAVVASAALGPAPASALTLWVNGDTPSVRWQGTVNRSLIPLPEGDLVVRLEPCPYDYGEAEGANVYASACIDLSARPRVVYVDPNRDSFFIRQDLFHETGHAFAEDYMTEGARRRFARIWKRPPLGWDEPLAPQRHTVLGPDIGTSGISSSASEWFADAYSVCAVETWKTDGDGSWRLGIIPWGRTFRDALIVERKIRATCALIRSVKAS